MDILKTLINPIALRVFDNSGNVTLIVIFSLICSLLILLSLFLLKRKQYIFCTANFILLVLILITTLLIYNRGNKLNDIRNNGYILLNTIEKFKSLNNRYPYDIDELYSFMSSRNDDNLFGVKKTQNYYRIKYDTSASDSSYKFDLFIDDDLLGLGSFVYYNNPIRFELKGD